MKDCFGNEEEYMGHKKTQDCCQCLPAQRFEDLSNGTGSAGPFTVTTGTVFTVPTPVNIVSVSVNVDDFLTDPFLNEGSCCRKSRVLLAFTANVSINPLAVFTTLNYNLVRSSCNSTVILGPLTTFGFTTAPGFPFVVANGFRYLDKNIEPGNYTYSVQIAPGSSVTGLAGLLGASVTINNATLAAIAAAV